MPVIKHGIVTAMAMTGTVTVTVHRFIFHPIYKKRYRESKKYLVEFAGHDVHVGDKVRIRECRPLSKRKHFQIETVLKRAAQVSEIAPGQTDILPSAS